jgi:type IV pilus assembly protein PilY1
VSDPENPTFMWSITGGSGDFAELGYTFSEPTVGRLDWGAGGARPVLVFAGGFDKNKDVRGSVGTNDTMGNAIFVVDAETGALVWKAVKGGASPSPVSLTQYQHPSLLDSIPSAVAAVDSDGDSLLDRIVVGDTGGNVWRVDMPNNNRNNWKIALLAKLGRHAAGSAGKLDDRRFFHRPDVVKSKDATASFDAVLIGSGDRPDPLDKGGSVDNYLYMIKDRDTSKGPSADVNIEHSALGDVTDNCLQDGSCGATPPNLSLGWKLKLEDDGEKSLASPLTVAGIAFFTTYLPTSSSTIPCQPSEGSGRLYALSLQDATSVINYDTTDDDPNQEEGVATTKDDRSRLLRSPGIPPEVVALPGVDLGAESGFGIITPGGDIENPGLVTRWRTFWFLGEDTDL